MNLLIVGRVLWLVLGFMALRLEVFRGEDGEVDTLRFTFPWVYLFPWLALSWLVW